MCIIELLTVVNDEYPGSPESAYDWLPCKIPDILVGDLGQGLSLFPFCEVVDVNH